MPLHVAPLPPALTTSTSPSSSPSTSPTTKRCSTPAIDSDYEWDDTDVAFEKQCEIRGQQKPHCNININTSQRQWEHHDEILVLTDIEVDDTLEHELDDDMDDSGVDYECSQKFRLIHDGIYNRHIHREKWSKTFHEPHVSREMAHHQLQHGSNHYVYSKKHIAAMRIKHETTTYHHRRTQRQRRQQVQDDFTKSQTGPMPRIVKDDHGVPIMNSPFEKRPRKNREADRLRYKQQMETIIQLQKTWDQEQIECGVTPPPKPINTNNVTPKSATTRWDRVLQQRHAKQQARRRRTAQATHTILPPSHSSAIASHPKRSRPRRTPGKKSPPVTTSRFIPLVPAAAAPAPAPTSTKKHVPLPASWHHNTAKQDFASFRRHFYDYHHDKIHESLKNGPYGVALRCVPVGEQAQEKFMSAYRQHPQIPALTYHGTSIQHMQSICDHGLLMPHEHRKGIANGSAYGVGIYTATQANISVGYCRSISTMFICAVLDKPLQREHVVTPSSFVVLFNSSLVIPLFLLDFVYDLDPKEITPFTTSTTSIPRWSVRFTPSPLEIPPDDLIKPRQYPKSILSNWATRRRQAEIGRHQHIRYSAITCE